LLVRYGKSERGKRIPIASIYTQDEHKIDPRKIDRDALKIIHRLRGAGHEAYIVGGAVRDLLMGKVPKDFDIATDALPRKIKRLFRNSRIIGRRFRLVHVFYGEKIIEVSTFRSNEGGDSNNVFGTLEDDVRRRDFSLNALFYSPEEGYVLDYVGGYKDIQNRRMRSLIDLNVTFLDDPVRLVRAVKYAENTGCAIPFAMRRAMKKYAGEMARCPSSRLTEEIFKILQCGNSAGIFRKLEDYKLLVHMLPVIHERISGKPGRECRERLYRSLAALDELIAGQEETPRSEMLARLADPFLEFPADAKVGESLFLDTFKAIKGIISPITPANHDVELAVRSIFTVRGLKSPRKPRKRHPRRPPRKAAHPVQV